MAPVASFHLVRFPPARAPGAAARFLADRPILARTQGLTFARSLGTAAGSSTRPGADLRRWALFAVWERPEDLARFETSSSVVRRWQDHGAEVWGAALEPVAAHGAWGGRDPFEGAGVPARAPADRPAAGRVAVLTRATVRWRRWQAFRAAVPDVDDDLAAQPARLASLGVGEWPVGRQGTFSVWASAAAVHRYAWDNPAHRAVIRRTRAEGWYAEELFARFAVVRSWGTWDGSDPAAAPGPGTDGHDDG